MTFIGSNSSLITLTYLIAATLSPTSSVNFVADSPSLSLSQGILKFTASHYASGASPYVISNTPDILTSGTQVNITSNYPSTSRHCVSELISFEFCVFAVDIRIGNSKLLSCLYKCRRNIYELLYIISLTFLSLIYSYI